ncbi:SIS domain-containing protein [Enterococcus gallinarum]|nr:SIS domain-containing protein [Enterococcus gallinarum]MCW3744796.1 SIS domain-containing protein [Enterococcus gallinarum]
MLNFNEERIYQEHQNGVDLVKKVEKIVDEIVDNGYKNIFLLGIGGTYLYADQVVHTVKQLGCQLPIYLENAQDFVYEGNANFTKDSVVVIASLSGHTVEVEKAIDIAHEVGARVIGYVEQLNTPLAEKVDYLANTFGAEYYWWYSVLLRFMNKAGQFEEYEKFMDELKSMPSNIVNVYKKQINQWKITQKSIGTNHSLI